MNIQLAHIQTTNVSYEVKTFKYDITKLLETSLNVGTAYDDSDNTKFAIIFEIELSDADNNFNLSVKSVAHFNASEAITDEFKKSSFVKMSAPAIAFPYVRTFISNLTLNSGYDPVLLPTFNFVKLATESENSIPEVLE